MPAQAGTLVAMKGKGFMSAVLLLGFVGANAQTQVDLRRQSKSVDFSAASSTRPARMGTVLPSTCNAGELFFMSAAAPGANLYVCAATNTWAAVTPASSGGSGGSTGTAQLSVSGSTLTMAAGICEAGDVTPYSSAGTIAVSGSDTGYIYVGYDSSCNRICYAGAGLTVSNYQTSGFNGNSCIAGSPPATNFTETGYVQVVAGALQSPNNTMPTVYVPQSPWYGPGPMAPPGYWQCLMDSCASRDGNGANSAFQGSVREFAFIPRADWFASRLTVNIVSGDTSGCSGQGCMLSLGIADSDTPHSLLAQGNATVTTSGATATVTFPQPLALTAYHEYFVRLNTNSQASLTVSGGAEVPTVLNANAIRAGVCSNTVTNPGASQSLPATCGTFTAAPSGAVVPLIVIE